jgi:hypothetical protein
MAPGYQRCPKATLLLGRRGGLDGGLHGKIPRAEMAVENESSESSLTSHNDSVHKTDDSV